MMKLIIRVKDGQPFEHPILEDNFCQAFPDVDVNNLPAEFARFERIAPPELGPYELYEGVTYEKIGDIFKDVHHVRQMTADEKLALQEKTKLEWNNRYPSWSFNEELCAFVAPISYPTDGKIYSWDEASTSWVEVEQTV